MSAIDAAAAAADTPAAGRKPQSGKATDDGSFTRVYDSLGQEAATGEETTEETTAGRHDARSRAPHVWPLDTAASLNRATVASPSLASAPIGARDGIVEPGLPDSDTPDPEDDNVTPGRPDTASPAKTDLPALLAGLLSRGAETYGTPGASAEPEQEQPEARPSPHDAQPRRGISAVGNAGATTEAQTARLTVLGRETHFAPTDMPTRGGFSGGGLSRDAASHTATATAPVSVPEDGITADRRMVGQRVGTETSDEQQVTARAGTATRSAVVESAAPGPGLPDSANGAFARAIGQIVAQARALTSDSEPASDAQRVPAPAPAPAAQGVGGPVRILRLQLQPEELGLVTARLRIVGGALELRLTAERQQSVEILRRDSEGLLEALRRAGYKPEIAAIDFARPQPAGQTLPASQPTAQTAGQAHGQAGYEAGAGLTGGDGGAERRQAPDREGTDRQAAGREADDIHADATPRARRDPGAVYL
ncbi:chemotaxis protein MotD [Pseudochelatococcus lubricantis]|uniref:Chemotaxis protein MotD n=1 Tax=Pseudochelatococcus lubricantis TaxID=1538102 RepID=A0ABX0UVA0_9HYPH|nr:flagellar hook-length control protein FliK [Pseudochelatococcus lubricantis]NIJ56887.1 chemotaxis protein MotD [Pseudochelatococcus lubricantis]